MDSLLLNDLSLGRRSALSLLGGAAAMSVSGAAAQSANPPTKGGLNYADPKDNLYAFGKIFATYDDKPVIGGFHGLMYLYTGERRMEPLFGYVGTGVLQAKIDENGALWRKSRETGYFTDLRTGDILETWDNPFTGERVPVYHFYNDLACSKWTPPYMPRLALGKSGDAPTLFNAGSVFPDADGNLPLILPFSQVGADHMMLSWDYTHEYTNPVTPEGWPSYSTGARITPSEHFTFNISKRELEDRSVPTVRTNAGFSRLSPPWPFMKMGKSPLKNAVVFGRMFSHKGLKGYDEVPRKVLNYIEKHAPRYLEMPEGWEEQRLARLDTWMAFAQDVPPETPGHPWKKPQLPRGAEPPTGLGAKIYKT